MSTLKEDIQALQQRSNRELGLQFQIDIKAHATDQAISKETALRVGEIVSEALGATVMVLSNCVDVESPDGICFSLYYDELAEEEMPTESGEDCLIVYLTKNEEVVTNE